MVMSTLSTHLVEPRFFVNFKCFLSGDYWILEI